MDALKDHKSKRKSISIRRLNGSKKEVEACHLSKQGTLPVIAGDWRLGWKIVNKKRRVQKLYAVMDAALTVVFAGTLFFTNPSRED